ISTAPGGFPSSNTLFVPRPARSPPDVESRVLEQRNSARSDLDRAVGHGPLPSPKESRHKGRELWLSSHSSSFFFTGTFRYDSPSLGIVRKISCPGVASRASLGARHSASLCTAASSSSGIVCAALRYIVTPIISATIATVAPASVPTHHRRVRLAPPAASAAASTRAWKFAGGSAPRATSGKSSSSCTLRARTASSSLEQIVQVRRCSSKSFVVAPVSAASRSWSFHFSHASFISSLPTEVFAPCATATSPSLLEFQASRPHWRRPSLQLARAARRFGVSPVSVQFLSGAAPAALAAPRLSRRQPLLASRSSATPYLVSAVAGGLSAGSTPAEKRFGLPTRGISLLRAATQSSGKPARTLLAQHLRRPRHCPKCCRQSEKLAADSQRCARQIPPRDCAFQLSQSAHSCTPQSRLCCPFLV